MVSHHKNRSTNVADKVISREKPILDLPEHFSGEIGEKERRLDKSEIKKGAIPEDEGEEMNKAKNDHGYPVF
jgi:hypothetical protein